MNPRTLNAVGWAILALAAAAPAARSQPPATPAPLDDPAVVYRYDPLNEQLIAVPAEEIKPGYVYNRYHPLLRRRVWSHAVAGGGFVYAMAPGSVQPARALDLRATPQQLRDALTSRTRSSPASWTFAARWRSCGSPTTGHGHWCGSQRSPTSSTWKPAGAGNGTASTASR